MAHHTQDDGFHEIQLNGKQLVFLFMAATVVSVVIFLCGVLVGRGVRAERAGAAGDATAAAASPDVVPDAAAGPAAPAATPANADPTRADVDDLSYFDRLDKPTAPVERLKPASAGRPEPHATDAHPATARQAPTGSAGEPGLSEPPGSGYAVQVAALNDRPEANTIARRLVGKGYAAYVLAPAAGTPTVYRVRVGKFETRREAEAVAAKLKKEEQFSPWITR